MMFFCNVFNVFFVFVTFSHLGSWTCLQNLDTGMCVQNYDYDVCRDFFCILHFVVSVNLPLRVFTLMFMHMKGTGPMMLALLELQQST